MLYVRTGYDQVSLDPTSPLFVKWTTKQQFGDTTYYTIPTATPPLLQPFTDFGVPPPIIDLVEPAVRTATGPSTPVCRRRRGRSLRLIRSSSPASWSTRSARASMPHATTSRIHRRRSRRPCRPDRSAHVEVHRLQRRRCRSWGTRLGVPRRDPNRACVRRYRRRVQNAPN
jgi:hypothetical protein